MHASEPFINNSPSISSSASPKFARPMHRFLVLKNSSHMEVGRTALGSVAYGAMPPTGRAICRPGKSIPLETAKISPNLAFKRGQGGAVHRMANFNTYVVDIMTAIYYA